MKKLLLAVAALLFCSSSAQATTFTWNLILSGLNEFPTPIVSPATGTATIVLDDVAKTLALDITFSGLSGNATGAHIHCCQATPGTGPNVGVATTTPTFIGFPVVGTSGTYNATLNLNSPASYNTAFMGNVLATQQAALINGLIEGRTYLNIHTAANPGGEIRAQITATPEPATLSLLGLGLAGLIARRRRAQR